MFCSNCGNKIPDAAKFCPHCGKPNVLMSDWEATAANTNEDPAPQEPEKETADVNEIPAPQKPEKETADVNENPAPQKPEKKLPDLNETIKEVKDKAAGNPKKVIPIIGIAIAIIVIIVIVAIWKKIDSSKVLTTEIETLSYSDGTSATFEKDYVYDEEGKITGIYYYSPEDSEQSWYRYEEYVYSDGLLTDIYEYDYPYWTIKYAVWDYHEEYIYEDGIISSVNCYNDVADPYIIDDWKIYTYDENGNLHVDEYDEDGLWISTDYTYDKYGNVLEEDVYYPEDEEGEYRIYTTYEYQGTKHPSSREDQYGIVTEYTYLSLKEALSQQTSAIEIDHSGTVQYTGHEYETLSNEYGLFHYMGFDSVDEACDYLVNLLENDDGEGLYFMLFDSASSSGAYSEIEGMDGFGTCDSINGDWFFTKESGATIKSYEIVDRTSHTEWWATNRTLPSSGEEEMTCDELMYVTISFEMENYSKDVLLNKYEFIREGDQWYLLDNWYFDCDETGN